MDIIDGIIIGAAGSVIGAIIISKFVKSTSVGGGSPAQPVVPSLNATSGGQPAALYVVDLEPTPINAAPVAQVNPITEAAYNQYPVLFEPGFGPTVNGGLQQEAQILPA